jgi:hypothetical protein
VNETEPLEVFESKTLHIVAEDLDNHYSQVQTLLLIKQQEAPHREDPPLVMEALPDGQQMGRSSPYGQEPALPSPSGPQDTQEFFQHLQALVALGLERHLVTVDQLASFSERLLRNPVGAA